MEAAGYKIKAGKHTAVKGRRVRPLGYGLQPETDVKNSAVPAGFLMSKITRTPDVPWLCKGTY